MSHLNQVGRWMNNSALWLVPPASTSLGSYGSDDGKEDLDFSQLKEMDNEEDYDDIADNLSDWDIFEHLSSLLEQDQVYEWYEREAVKTGMFLIFLIVSMQLMNLFIAEKLTSYDQAICCAFLYKVQFHTTDCDFTKLPYAFLPDSLLPLGLNTIHALVSFLAGFKSEYYDYCINSYCCFTGPHE